MASADNNPYYISDVLAAGNSSNNSTYKVSFKSIGKKLDKPANNVKVGLREAAVILSIAVFYR